MNMFKLIFSIFFIIGNVFFIKAYDPATHKLGENEAIRTYIEFTDGKDRGMYDPETNSKGFPDEDYDATTAMVINWHRMPEKDSLLNTRLKYRMIYPDTLSWAFVNGESFGFWYRSELINRVKLRDLRPNSIYEYQVKEHGISFRFRTMPESLDERTVKIVTAGDHQKYPWTPTAHANAKLIALQQPDMFLSSGDLVSCGGRMNSENAERWATYLDILYNADSGYFIYDMEIDGCVYRNFIIPHVSILGNHELTNLPPIQEPNNPRKNLQKYPLFVSANWMELLFYWPFRSEGFRNELNFNHPNMDPEHVRAGFGHGGFGALSFSDYLLVVGLDNVLNWEGEPLKGFRDWTDGNKVTDVWSWFEELHSEVRQDLWLSDLMEPEGKKKAGESYKFILPVWHRAFFGTVRPNLELRNRDILKYWLPVLHNNGIKLIIEGHDHCYTRTVPISISFLKPDGTFMDRAYLEVSKHTPSYSFDAEYLTDFYSVNCLRDSISSEITGWEYSGKYVYHDPEGMIAVGHGGWAANRREIGKFSEGNTGTWFVDQEKGGDTFTGREAFHITTIELRNDGFIVDAYCPDQSPDMDKGIISSPFFRFRWDREETQWFKYDFNIGQWVNYDQK